MLNATERYDRGQPEGDSCGQVQFCQRDKRALYVTGALALVDAICAPFLIRNHDFAPPPARGGTGKDHTPVPHGRVPSTLTWPTPGQALLTASSAVRSDNFARGDGQGQSVPRSQLTTVSSGNPVK
jgi:hypothetical protein